ncbi:MAG TPA: tRNA lysidine(34) synthetase TilS [Candidatus Saccharimonadales bacterium]|nr:tRNA lysidine(34) synthetase TilS [Candidatus Saccharimonadales bacterium]
MTLTLPPLQAGTYIIAVSGGVDSMVLLDLLRRQTHLTLYVAHINHGIRQDGHLDEALVSTFCLSHNIPCITEQLTLGEHTSEERARTARYDFLRKCRDKYNADAIVTAHHQDDLIETALIAMLRGTGWRGLAPFTHTPSVVRPLVNVPKRQLLDYASAHAIPWREDSTNADERYLRNYVRRTLVPLLSKRDANWADYFLQLIREQQHLRRKIEDELDNKLTLYVVVNGTTLLLNRYEWVMLPELEAYELFQALCRKYLGHSVVRDLALRALLFIKTARPHKTMPLGVAWQLRATTKQIIVEAR